MADKNDDAYWGAEDPSEINEADPDFKTGTLADVFETPPPEEETPEESEDTTDETPADEVPGDTTPASEETPSAPAEEDPRIKAARLEGELEAMRRLYTQQPKPEPKPEPKDPVLELAELPETEAVKKYEGLLSEEKYAQAQTFWSQYQSARLVAPSLRALQQRNAEVLGAYGSLQSQLAESLMSDLDKATKGDAKNYSEDIRALLMAEKASRAMGNPPYFNSLLEVYNAARARKASTVPAGTAVPSGTGKRALGTSPGAGTAARPAAGGKRKKLTPEEQALEDLWEYDPGDRL